MAEVDRIGIAAVLAADAEFDVRPRGAALLDGDGKSFVTAFKTSMTTSADALGSTYLAGAIIQILDHESTQA